MKKEVKFIDFVKVESKGKTDVHEVRTIDHAILLGHIKWHGAWRKYCFFPQGNTVFDTDCLNRISVFLTAAQMIWKTTKKLKPLKL